ncbi:transketolase family protein [Petroclostridium xylanilyticum]|jgi:transketolase|uniref:transketolase family protein n=1 Tax=Petroclostridium xylanilyticum TaxID=1792311 RepID=UPI000B98D2D0|nr:transketolase C-terminal domain-containing protein [Petroclostridium xylanilyticum]
MADKKAIRDAYGEVLVKIGRENKNVVVLDADVASSSKSILFGKEFPDRFFNVGIAEANMAAMAAGLATTGKIPFVNTFAAFMVLRAADSIRSLISYTNLNVKLAGTYAGLSDSYDGASHHAIADIAFMRALPNMTVISVADAVETEMATRAVVDYKGPVYLRLSRAEVPIIFDTSYNFEIGKGVQLTDGNDVTIVATGYMVQKALEAADQLKAKGIKARVVNIHTIKPIDKELLVKCAQETGAVVTAEEHNIYGGLGAAVAEVLTKEYPIPMEYVGVQDVFAESGDYEQLLKKYGLSAENIVYKVESVVKRKK